MVFAGAVVAGVFKGIKEFREFSKPPPASHIADEKSQIAAVTLLENVTLSEWTKSNRDARVGMDRLCDMIEQLHDEMRTTRHKLEDTQRELARRGNDDRATDRR